MRGGPIIIMKQYTKPSIKEMPVALQQLLCGSLLDINNEEVDEQKDPAAPSTWGTIW